MKIRRPWRLLFTILVAVVLTYSAIVYEIHVGCPYRALLRFADRSAEVKAQLGLFQPCRRSLFGFGIQYSQKENITDVVLALCGERENAALFAHLVETKDEWRIAQAKLKLPSGRYVAVH